jgi:hypothetical protein
MRQSHSRTAVRSNEAVRRASRPTRSASRPAQRQPRARGLQGFHGRRGAGLSFRALAVSRARAEIQGTCAVNKSDANPCERSRRCPCSVRSGQSSTPEGVVPANERPRVPIASGSPSDRCRPIWTRSLAANGFRRSSESRTVQGRSCQSYPPRRHSGRQHPVETDEIGPADLLLAGDGMALANGDHIRIPRQFFLDDVAVGVGFFNNPMRKSTEPARSFPRRASYGALMTVTFADL